MSSVIDQKDIDQKDIDHRNMNEDFAELLEALEADDTPPEAFYLALRNALVQSQQHASLSQL